MAITNQKVHHPGRMRRTREAFEEQEMGTKGQSLRWLIDKWLTPGQTIRLTRYSYPGASHHRCIRIESSRTTGPFALFFFRHDDGLWRVFPPGRERPMMGRYGRFA